MLLEGFVAIMAMIAAASMQPGVYFAVNSPAGVVGATPAAAVATITSWHFPVTVDTMAQLAHSAGDKDSLRTNRRRALARSGHGANLQRRTAKHGYGRQTD